MKSFLALALALDVPESSVAAPAAASLAGKYRGGTGRDEQGSLVQSQRRGVLLISLSDREPARELRSSLKFNFTCVASS